MLSNEEKQYLEGLLEEEIQLSIDPLIENYEEAIEGQDDSDYIISMLENMSKLEKRRNIAEQILKKIRNEKVN